MISPRVSPRSTTVNVEVEPRNRTPSALTSASGLSPTRTTGEAPLDGGAAELVGAGVVGATHQDAPGVDPVDELVEHGTVGLLGAVVVEVVRLDVGDHGDVRA